MKIFFRNLFGLLFVLFATTSLCFAQSGSQDEFRDEVVGGKNSKTVYRYKKWTRIDLDESVVEGEIKDPNRIEIKVSPEKSFGTLLRPRTNFLKELRQDVDQVR